MRVLLACLMLLIPTVLQAHTRSQSTSSWSVRDTRLTGVFQVDALRATQLISSPTQIATLPLVVEDHVARTVSVLQNGKACRQSSKLLQSAAGIFRIELAFRCQERISINPVTLSIASFRAQSASHTHFARVQLENNTASEWLLSGTQTTIIIGGPDPQKPSGFLAFVKLGTVHVLSGLDHIAFLLGLLLMTRTRLRVMLAATGFTLGHSLTLAAVVMGKLQPDIAAIESLIGFSVAFAALDVVRSTGFLPRAAASLTGLFIGLMPMWIPLLGMGHPSWASSLGIGLFASIFLSRRGTTNPWLAQVLAAGFGLVHGAGFAGVLIDMKLPPGDMLRPLLGFNVGVELGQIIVIMFAAAVAFVLARLAPARLRVAEAATLALLTGLGSFWFISRL